MFWYEISFFDKVEDDVVTECGLVSADSLLTAIKKTFEYYGVEENDNLEKIAFIPYEDIVPESEFNKVFMDSEKN